ncbi:hypothetical protein ASG99_13775 [Bacillus sp. Soil768D1]|nr:hypothetical protein ASG99_13775 [Bacillus sp. Soil768D1]
MKIKMPFVAFLLCLLFISGCESKKEKEVVQPVEQSKSNDMPSFVKESDIEKINWDRMVTKIGTNGPSDIIGNKNKLGIIGPELLPKKVEKWLWHFWGVSSGKLTIVGS